MEKSFLDVYELFKLICSDGNMLQAYYPFLASIIVDKRIDRINVNLLKKEFEEKYSIPISEPFIRQVLGVGIDNHSIVKKFGEYVVDVTKLKEYKLPENDFDNSWKILKSEFDNFCKSNSYQTVNDRKFEELVLSLIDTYSLKFIVDNDWSGDIDVAEQEYYWYKFISALPEINSRAFEFLAYLSASDTYREALFVSKKEDVRIENLNIYLDSPMVFALLGMDSEERCAEYQELVKKIQKAGCKVMVLDNNFEEVHGIIVRASSWASSSAYDISKANKVAKYFHDREMSRADVLEYSESLESKLNDLGIIVKQTSYDTLQNTFQEDEETLFDMVKAKYSESNMLLSPEKEESIRCDVKSIIMVYRERRGRIATRIQSCAELMLTRNAALANVCKQYEKNKSINAGHIPACISGDLFGAILWLNSPMESVEYQKKKILADCYSALRPNKKLLNKYVDSLNLALKTGEIDERKYLMMRANTVVEDALMNVTKGDYARFNDRTYAEVYEEIQAIASKDYNDEKKAHEVTKQILAETRKEEENTKSELKNTKDKFAEYIKKQEQKETERYENKCKTYGNIATNVISIFPYFFVYIIFEFIKAKVTMTMTARNIGIIVLMCAVTYVLKIFYKKLNDYCIERAHNYVKKN